MTADVAFECRRKLNVPRRSARNTAEPLSYAGRMELPIEVRAHAEEMIRRFCEARVPEDTQMLVLRVTSRIRKILIGESGQDILPGQLVCGAHVLAILRVSL